MSLALGIVDPKGPPFLFSGRVFQPKPFNFEEDLQLSTFAAKLTVLGKQVKEAETVEAIDRIQKQILEASFQYRVTLSGVANKRRFKGERLKTYLEEANLNPEDFPDLDTTPEFFTQAIGSLELFRGLLSGTLNAEDLSQLPNVVWLNANETNEIVQPLEPPLPPSDSGKTTRRKK